MDDLEAIRALYRHDVTNVTVATEEDETESEPITTALLMHKPRRSRSYGSSKSTSKVSTHQFNGYYSNSK